MPVLYQNVPNQGLGMRFLNFLRCPVLYRNIPNQGLGMRFLNFLRYPFVSKCSHSGIGNEFLKSGIRNKIFIYGDGNDGT
ncbi:hypothetical protein BH10BAC5_BH10BAC5_01770 [soil metagenome]